MGSRFSEKQMLLATVGVSGLLVLVFGVLIYLDLTNIYAAEITEGNPEAAEITDAESHGELRKIQEIEREMESARAEADKISDREQKVIVLREIVERDAAILPDFDDVNHLVDTIDEFERNSGVSLHSVDKLNPSRDAKGKAIRTMPISLKCKGTYDQILKFINLFENLDRIVNTRGFTIIAGRPDPEGDAIHDATLELVTYIYTRSAGLAKAVNIVGYDKRKDDPVIQKLIRQQKPAHVEKYQLKHRVNRRDMLIDPRMAQDDVNHDTNDIDFEAQKAEVDRLRFEVQLLKEDVRQELVYEAKEMFVQLAQIKAVIDTKVKNLTADIAGVDPTITISEIREAFLSEVVKPFEKIKAGRDLIDTGPVLIAEKEVRQFHDNIAKLLESRQYAEVLRVWRQFKNRTSGKEIVEEAQPLLDQMVDMQHEAVTMIEFGRLAIDVSGLIIQPDEARSRVILNGRARRVGDYIDTRQRCRLDSITREKLVFAFAGERIELLLEEQ